MQKNKIDLSIIIISLSTVKYHTKAGLETTLKSMVPALKNVSHEVIIVDNTTISDGTLEMVKKYTSNCIYLKRSSVYSFCDNNNFGLKRASGKYILFLNNDVEFTDKNILEEMVDWMDKNPKIGVSTPALLNSDKKTLQRSGGYFPTLFRVIAWMTFLDDVPAINKLFNSYHPNLGYFNDKHKQDWITGAFYLVRKEILDKIGGFDEDYNAYVEETDLSFRIKKEGWEIWYLPKWKIVHFGGLSYGNENSLISELKNLNLFYKKHYPAWQLPILNVAIKLGCILRIIVFSFFKPSLVKIYAKAISN